MVSYRRSDGAGRPVCTLCVNACRLRCTTPRLPFNQTPPAASCTIPVTPCSSGLAWSGKVRNRPSGPSTATAASPATRVSAGLLHRAVIGPTDKPSVAL